MSLNDVDVELELVLDSVLSKAGVPLSGMPPGGDRGDLASDLADAVRRWMHVAVGTENVDRLLIRALVGRHLDRYLTDASFKHIVDVAATVLLPSMMDGLAKRADVWAEERERALQAFRAAPFLTPEAAAQLREGLDLDG